MRSMWAQQRCLRLQRTPGIQEHKEEGKTLNHEQRPKLWFSKWEPCSQSRSSRNCGTSSKTQPPLWPSSAKTDCVSSQDFTPGPYLLTLLPPTPPATKKAWIPISGSLTLGFRLAISDTIRMHWFRFKSSEELLVEIS